VNEPIWEDATLDRSLAEAFRAAIGRPIRPRNVASATAAERPRTQVRWPLGRGVTAMTRVEREQSIPSNLYEVHVAVERDAVRGPDDVACPVVILQLWSDLECGFALQPLCFSAQSGQWEGSGCIELRGELTQLELEGQPGGIGQLGAHQQLTAREIRDCARGCPPSVPSQLAAWDALASAPSTPDWIAAAIRAGVEDRPVASSTRAR